MTDTGPKRNEDEYFVRQNAELIKQMRAKLDAERGQAERTQSAMKCPRDGSALTETRRGDVVIDVCPTCNGIWFDAGEAELFAKSAAGADPGNVGGFLQDFTSLFGRRK